MRLKYFIIGLVFVLLPLTVYAKKEIPISVDGKSAVKALFVKSETCNPLLAWKELRQDPAMETYDISVYIALKGNAAMPDRGENIFYQEGVNVLQMQVPLKPGKKYFWSLRGRYQDGTVSDWLTHDPIHANLLEVISYRNMWFGIQTPKKCD